MVSLKVHRVGLARTTAGMTFLPSRISRPTMPPVSLGLRICPKSDRSTMRKKGKRDSEALSIIILF